MATDSRVNGAGRRNFQLPPGAALAGLFVSGAAGLIDEICWIRRSSLIFGSTSHALSTVLMVFFLGLALGGWAFGQIAQRARNPLRTCALIEAGLAAMVLATIPAFGAVEGLYGALFRSLPADSAALWLTRAGLISVVLLPPTFLMGGTLPLFGRQMVRDPGRIGDAVGRLYALNTLGAAVGCVLTGFVLIHGLGVVRSLVLAAGLNLIAAASMAFARAEPVEPTPAPSAKSAPVPHDVRRAVGALLLVTGFVALAEEVLWTRFLALLMRNSVHTYTVTLALVLGGIVLGSALAARLADRAKSRAWLFGTLQIVNGLLVWTLMMLPAAWWRGWGGSPAMAALLLVPPAFLSGASFPLAVRMVVSQPAWAGIGIGTMIAVNTLGGILGSMTAGFLILPAWGLEWGARLCSGLSLAAGLFAWFWLDRAGSKMAHAALGVLAIGAWLAVPVVTRTRLPQAFLADPVRLVDHREGLESNLAVVRRPSGALVMEIDRWWQGQDRRTHQVMAAHLPLMLHPAPRSALLVGVGAGQTPLRLAMHDLERIDCIDIEPRVFDLVREHFESSWMSDPRVRLLRMDGRNYLTHAAARYDLISLEVGQLFRPGVASFYTADFYRQARERLTPGGLCAQFIPLPFLTADALRGVLATFLEAFPGATLWYNTSELLLIGAAGEAPALRPQRLAAVLADSTLSADLRFSLWGGPATWLARPEVLYASFLCGPPGLTRLSASGTIYRDDRPALETAAAQVREGDTREIETLPLLRRNLDPIQTAGPGLSSDFTRAAEQVREKNLDDIAAAAHLRLVDPALERKDYTAAAAALERALAANPGNLVAHRLMGDVQLLLGNAGEAERFFRQALAISESDARARAGMGFLCLTLGRLPEAVEHYRVALAGESKDPEIWNNLGAALGQTGDLAGAARHFEQALVLRPDHPDARRTLDRTRAAMASPGTKER